MFPITKKVTIKRKTYEYIQIIENYRVGKKIKQRIIYSLGRKDKLNPERVDALINNLERFSEKLIVLQNDNPDIRIDWSKTFGLPLLYQKLWKETGLADIIDEITAHRRHKFDIERSLFCLVLNRLMDPKSELAIHSWKEDVFLHNSNLNNLKLHHLYRTLDIIEEEKEAIEVKLFAKTRNLFNTEVNLVFFDTTSTYFEGTGKHSQNLLAPGFSRDHRPDCQQIVVGVLLDQQGVPIGCDVSPGNHTDPTIIKTLAEKVKLRFNLKDIIWVSDGGMAGEENIEKLNNLKYRFILGARMRNVKELYTKIENKQIREEIFNSMTPLPDQDHLRYYEFLSKKHRARRYLVIYNEKEAKREQQTREAIVTRLKEQLKTNQSIKALIKHRKYKSYLKIAKSSKVSLDQEKIKKDALYDGLFVLQTDTDLPAKEVIQRYKDLYQIEQAFCNLKSKLDLRPIYHRKDERITAHVFVNFLALYLQIVLRKLLIEQGFTEKEIQTGLRDIKKIQMSRVLLKENIYNVRTELQGKAHTTLKALGISPGQRIQKI